MIGAIILCFLLYGLTQPLLAGVKKKHRFVDVKLLGNLYWYHVVFWLIYYLYVLSAPSDSVGYFTRSSRITFGDWFTKYGTGTVFIEFAAYPFTGMLGFTYEMAMMLFAWLGYWGFVFFYIFFKENIKFSHKLKGYDVLTVLMFLPNMHFWTVSLGKGSIIFFGLGLATYGISRISKRKIAMILGLAVVYHVRPHVFLFLLVGVVMGFFTGREKVPLYQKVLVLGGGVLGMFLMYEQVLTFVGVDSENVVESFEAMTSHRASELARSGSGVDTSNYPLAFKLFTFWFRPLFVDAPGLLGLFVSVENLIYVVLTAKLFDKKFLPYFMSSGSLVKSSLVIFVASSVALSTTMSNLGIIIRQKSMVMYFFFFLILSFMDYKREQLEKRKKKRLALQQLQAAGPGNGQQPILNPTNRRLA